MRSQSALTERSTRPAQFRRWIRRISAGIGLIALLTLVLLAYVHSSTAALRYANPALVPTTRVAVIFGAGVRGERPSRILADRLDAAIVLYQQNQVQKLLMTGDNSRIDYDEVTIMRRYAEARGVAASDITLDYAGFSTYESCYRARAIFGLEEAILVTQQYHLPRAVYTCRALGIAATGVGTPDWGRFPDAAMLRYTIREAVATLKALVDVHLLRPEPTFLGPFEGVS